MRNRQRIRNSVFDDTANIITVTMEKFDFTVAGSGPGGYIEAAKSCADGNEESRWWNEINPSVVLRSLMGETNYLATTS